MADNINRASNNQERLYRRIFWLESQLRLWRLWILALAIMAGSSFGRDIGEGWGQVLGLDWLGTASAGFGLLLGAIVLFILRTTERKDEFLTQEMEDLDARLVAECKELDK